MANYRDNSNIGWKIFSLFLALVLVAGIITGMVFWRKENIVFNPVKQEEADEKPEDNGGAVVGESTGNGIKLMTAKIASEEYANYGISPLSETAYTVTATVEPSNATYKDLTWAAFWVSTSGWASDKTVSDYVTITSSEDTLSAVMECKKGFATQIQVVVSYVHDSKISATCTVDYLQKYQDAFTGYISLDSVSGEKVNFSSSADTRISIDFPFADNSELSYLGTRNSEISITPQGNDEFTIPMEYSLTKVEMLMSSNMSRAFAEYPAGCGTVTSGTLTALSDVSYEDGKCTGLIQKFMGITDYSGGNVSSIKSKLGSYYNDCYYEYKIYFSVNGEEKTVYLRLSFDKSSIATPVTNIDLSDSNIIF